MLLSIHHSSLIHHSSRRRRGISLTEVLIAILVMGLGVTSLATLYPIGLVSLRSAAVDTRVTVLARSAASALAVKRGDALAPGGVADVVEEMTDYGDASPYEGNNGGGADPTPDDDNLFIVDDGPAGSEGAQPGGVAVTNAPVAAANRSYPLFVDPMAVYPANGQTALSSRIGRMTNPPDPLDNRGIRRVDTRLVRVAFAAVGASAARAAGRLSFGSGDDVLFGQTQEATATNQGNPVLPWVDPTSTRASREYGYSWAVMLHLDDIADPPSSAVRQFVVFHNRTLGPDSESAYPGNYPPQSGQPSRAFFKGSTEVRLNITGRPLPEIKAGQYILDATNEDFSAGSVPPPPYPSKHNGYFYRVIEVGRPVVVGSVTQLVLSLEEPARADGNVAVFMQGVVEVFVPPVGS